MNYTPGTIVSLIGVAYLIAAFFAPSAEEKAGRMRSGFINIGIGIVLILIFSTVCR